MTRRQQQPVHGPEACGAGDLETTVTKQESAGPCPGCGSDLTRGTIDHPVTGRPADMLMHPMPFCDYFGETDAEQIERDLLAERRQQHPVHGPEACGAGDLETTVTKQESAGPCPGCGSDLTRGTIDHPVTGRPADMLMHPMPFCDYFGETDAEQIERDLLAEN